MVSEAELLEIVAGLTERDLALYRAEGWVIREAETYTEIEVARVTLVHELHRDLGLEADAVGIVLSLIDQLHQARTALHDISEVLADQPEPVRKAVADRLAAQRGQSDD